MTKKDNVVPIDKDFESMLISAVRYAFGRRTYIVSTTTNYVGFLLPKLSDWCLSILNRDYTDNAALAERLGSYDSFGDQCDKNRWFEFAKKLRTEIDRRLNDGNRYDFLR